MNYGTRVKTLAPVYAGRQKNQKTNFTRLAAGVVGVIKDSEDLDFGITYYLVKFKIEHRIYYARLSASIFEEVKE